MSESGPGRPAVSVLKGIIIAAALSPLLSCRNAPPQTACPPEGRAAKREVPVVYDRRLDPIEVTAAQRELLMEWAARLSPDNAVWYIHVNDNTKFDDGTLIGNFTVFYRPESRGERIRKGKACRLWDVRESGDRVEHPRYWSMMDPREWAIFDWVQVSRKEEPFGGEIEVPEKALWPFLTPDGFADVEVIEIVDFARNPPDVPEDVLSFELPEKDEPVFSISREKDGTIEVMFGTQQGGLAGGGAILVIEKQDGNWRVRSMGGWIS